jgi:hypothetical protein
MSRVLLWWAGPDSDRRPSARQADVLTRLDDRPTCAFAVTRFRCSEYLWVFVMLSEAGWEAEQFFLFGLI